MRIATLVVVALMATVVAVSAQTPYIAVYFDQYLTQETKDCPGPMVDNWYVAAKNFNAFLTGAEFAIEYPAAVSWLADLNKPPVSVGATPTGISMGFALPQNGFFDVFLCNVQVFWNCSACAEPFLNNAVKVVANPATGFLGVTDFPQYNAIPCVGLTSYICATVPAEETSWGQVKALYGE
jgi:hypothetical protein